jgi:hypothetical protein
MLVSVDCVMDIFWIFEIVTDHNGARELELSSSYGTEDMELVEYIKIDEEMLYTYLIYLPSFPILMRASCECCYFMVGEGQRDVVGCLKHLASLETASPREYINCNSPHFWISHPMK